VRGRYRLNPTAKTFTMEFELIDHEYIQLNQLLKLLGLVETGGEANQRIVDGEVKVNNKVEYQKRKKLRKDDTVSFGRKIITIT
jgi:ribosome-associated protein